VNKERTVRDLHEATLEAVGATRCVLQSDQAGLAVLLSGSEDIYLLAAQLARLSAFIVEASVGADWPKVMALLGSFVVDAAPEPETA
jgi:hypothetical protein